MRELMEICAVGVMSPGEMGQAVGRVLRTAGLRVLTCLEGRSERTAARAAHAGIVAVADDLTLVRQADVILSILPPAHALAMAERIAAAVRATGTDLLYVDCNAIAPQTTCKIGDMLAAASVRYVDGGIIGGPPASRETPTRLYVSGLHARYLIRLQAPELQVRMVGPSIGQASGLKMCYAALTKGLTALATEALAAGHVLGLEALLWSELRESQGALLAWIERSIPRMPPKADRWIGEMEEIAATFGAVGLPPELMVGAAALYRLVSENTLPEETLDMPLQSLGAGGVAQQLAAHVSPNRTRA
jgi:3-hydroxyisobutyrate dehydrogenase-like beta-hydroxyacid dehydrogenase